ncbi:hypothetical protein [Dysgonomonas termitidis]|uniref:Uncharacterized protein n=1 Tax=Dysgonomonas termitidis TaxID=1516126 RepID=A0ABV9L2W8_9BACT
MEKSIKSNVWLETMTFLIATKNWIIEIWLLFILGLRLRMAIKLADMKHFIRDKRYFVYPDRISGGLLVLNNDEIDIRKKQKLMPPGMKYLEIRNRCFYVTATKRYGTDAPTEIEKKEMRDRYLNWQKLLKPFFRKARVGIPVVKKKK